MKQHTINAEVLRWALLANSNTGTKCRWAAMADGRHTRSACDRSSPKPQPHRTPSQLEPMTRGNIGWLMSKVFIGGGNAEVRATWGAGIAELMRENQHMLTPPTPKPPPSPLALRMQLARVARSNRTPARTSAASTPKRFAIAS